MAEYAGYVSPDKFLDWEALSSKTAEKIYGIGTKRTAEKEALDQQAKDIESIVNDPSNLGQSQTLNSIILDGADNARNNIYAWNKDLKAGKISPKEYKERLGTLNEYWGTLANSAKTFDQRYQEVMNRQQPDENGNIPASAYEMELANRFGQMADLGNSKLQVASNGRVFMTKVDPKTGAIMGDVTDVRTINAPENIVANRVVVPTVVSNLTKDWDPVTTFKDLGRGGELNIEDIRQNPEFATMKAKVAESVASDNNPRAQISVLVDNGVMNADYYMNDAEYNQKREEAIDYAKQVKRTAGLPDSLTDKEIKDIEFNLVRVQKDPAGIINPILTDEQKKAAKDRVMQEVEMQMEKKITGSPKQQWSSGSSGGGSGSGDDNAAMIAGYKSTLEAFGIDTEAVKNGQIVNTGSTNFNGLSRSYQYRRTGQGVEVYKAGSLDADGKPIIDDYTGKAASPITIAKEPKDLAQYVYGGQDVAKTKMKYEKARTMYLGGTKPTASTGKTTYKIKGKTYSLDQLKGMGYSEKDIEQYKI